MINEPYPFNPKWRLIKFSGPGLKYEVAIAIYSNDSCWANGPFPGSVNESRIFHERLWTELPHYEPVEVDSGPGGDNWSMKPNAGMGSGQRKAKSLYRGKKETILSRLKQFEVLDSHFRHTDTDVEVMVYKHHSHVLMQLLLLHKWNWCLVEINYLMGETRQVLIICLETHKWYLE
jgi:hypothetical protein